MPPKSVTCSICQATVLKAQTLARSDGSRACRSHPQAALEAEQLRQQDQARIKQEVTQAGTRNPWGPSPEALAAQRQAWEQEAAAFRKFTYTHCWICHHEGVDLQEFFFNILVAQKRLQLRGEFDFFNLPQDVAKLVGKVLPLGMVALKDEVIDRAIVKHVLDKRLRDIVPLLRCVLFCFACAKKHGFGKRWEDLIPKPSLDEVIAFMPVTAAIDPLLTAIAEKKERQS